MVSQSFCTRDKYWFHCQWSHRLSRPPQLTPMFRGPGSVLCWFPSFQTEVHELPLAQVSCFWGFPQHCLDPLLITLLSLQLDSRSSAQCLAVDLCQKKLENNLHSGYGMATTHCFNSDLHWDTTDSYEWENCQGNEYTKFYIANK